MPNEEYRRTVGTLHSEHELQNQSNENTRGKSTGSRRNSGNDEYPCDVRCQQISSNYQAER